MTENAGRRWRNRQKRRSSRLNVAAALLITDAQYAEERPEDMERTEKK